MIEEAAIRSRSLSPIGNSFCPRALTWAFTPMYDRSGSSRSGFPDSTSSAPDSPRLGAAAGLVGFPPQTPSEDSSMDDKYHKPRPECGDSPVLPVSRREFVKVVGGAALGGGLISALGHPTRAAVAPTAKSSAETAVKRFYDTLTSEQKQSICFPFDHKLRKRINANWKIT